MKAKFTPNGVILHQSEERKQLLRLTLGTFLRFLLYCEIHNHSLSSKHGKLDSSHQQHQAEDLTASTWKISTTSNLATPLKTE